VIAVKNLGHQRPVENISENGGEQGSACGGKLQVDFVKILLGVVEKDQEARIRADERLHKRRTDAASGSGNEDGLASIPCAEQKCAHARVQLATELQVRTANSV
jgi:hypothetical protein